jgi:hypothetical protein
MCLTTVVEGRMLLFVHGITHVYIPRELDPQRGEFPSSQKILPPVRKSYSRETPTTTGN